MALEVLPTQQILLFEHCLRITLSLAVNFQIDALRDLVPSVQFNKREKHQCKPATLLKVTLLHGCFSRFLNCTSGIKSRRASDILKALMCFQKRNNDE